MVERQRARLEQEMSRLVDELDRSHLRKMQADMHRCAARCCDDTSRSLDGAHACVEGCGRELGRANDYVQAELNRVQAKLQRCVMQCNDDVRDSMEPNPTRDQNDRYAAKFEACAVSCVDAHVDSVPKLIATMKATLARGPPPT